MNQTRLCNSSPDTTRDQPAATAETIPDVQTITIQFPPEWGGTIQIPIRRSSKADIQRAFIPLIVWDLVLSALCSLAAVAAGASANRTHYAPKVLGIAALGGVVKAGVVNLPMIVATALGENPFINSLWHFVSAFGVSIGVTALTASMCIGRVPKELLDAAAVAAIPLFFSNVLNKATSPTTTAGILSPIFTIAAGLTFAAMARREGFYVCSLGSAAAAAVVYDILYAVGRAPCNCLLAIAGSFQIDQSEREALLARH